MSPSHAFAAAAACLRHAQEEIAKLGSMIPLELKAEQVAPALKRVKNLLTMQATAIATVATALEAPAGDTAPTAAGPQAKP